MNEIQYEEREFTVTAEDVANGWRGASRQCALAQCFHESGYPLAQVGFSMVFLGGRRDGIDLPLQAVEFRQAFDWAQEVKTPFTFTLRVPVEAGAK